MLGKVLQDSNLIQTTYYYSFYLFEALERMRMADRYLELLDPWHQMLDIGLSTFAEKPEPTRSDCHAWSASPNYHFVSLIGGIRPLSAGYRKVSISPAPGNLSFLQVSTPHPKGMISLEMERETSSWNLKLEVPAGVAAEVQWSGKLYPVGSGKQTLQLPISN